MTIRDIFPFSAIVGQELAKKGLIYNAIDPSIGGILIRGEKGTGKTTIVRGFASVLPCRRVTSGCRFNCLIGDTVNLCPECMEKLSKGEKLIGEEMPVEVIDLPLNASEDRVVGSIDMEAAIKEGIKRFETGILGRSNGNILYIDEVNLLDDHIVDVLLDVAVSGINIVEREGITYSHPSRFILVGTMNPEEGDLRPQLIDRFGLCVDIESEHNLGLRMEIVKRVLRYEKKDKDFIEHYTREDSLLRERIELARKRISSVEIGEELLNTIVEITTEIGVDGHRGDISIIKVAKAAAAFRNKREPSEDEITDAIKLSLPHRLKREPFEDVDESRQNLDFFINKHFKK